MPFSYVRDLHHKLQNLYQIFKSVKEYHKEMEINLLRAQIRERKDATVARFLDGLNREIQDMVQLHSYGILEELVHHATRGEETGRRRKTSSIKCFKSLGKGHIASQCPNKRAMIYLNELVSRSDD
ncbi:hypothetical protein CR513_20756, partial [Mucuna pruriens]